MQDISKYSRRIFVKQNHVGKKSKKTRVMMVHKNGSGWFNHNLSDLVVDSLASPGQIACLTMSNPAGASRSFIFPCGGGLVPGKTGLQKWRK